MNTTEFKRLVASSKVHQTLFHFTDTRNLTSISQLGLLSLKELTRRGLKIPAPGGNNWSHEEDRRIGMDSFVHLCFLDQHPMEFTQRMARHLDKTLFLQISPDVLDIGGLLVCDEVANKRGSKPEPFETGIVKLDLEVIYQHTDWKQKDIQDRRKLARKYELLVPNEIPPHLIRNLP